MLKHLFRESARRSTLVNLMGRLPTAGLIAVFGGGIATVAALDEPEVSWGKALGDATVATLLGTAILGALHYWAERD